jgi:hypothetical protein
MEYIIVHKSSFLMGNCKSHAGSFLSHNIASFTFHTSPILDSIFVFTLDQYKNNKEKGKIVK